MQANMNVEQRSRWSVRIVFHREFASRLVKSCEAILLMSNRPLISGVGGNPAGQELLFQCAYAPKSKSLEGNADYIAYGLSVASRKVAIGDGSCGEVAKKS